MIDIEFIKPNESESSVKLTVHRTGKLGFSKGAIDLMNIEKNKNCKFGKNKNKEEDEKLYMVVSNQRDNLSYKISKAGDYYYIKAKELLRELNIDYSDQATTVIFDIREIDNNGQRIFELNKREIKRRK